MTYDEKTKLVANIAAKLMTGSDSFYNESNFISATVDFAVAIVEQAEQRVHAPRQGNSVNLNEEVS